MELSHVKPINDIDGKIYILTGNNHFFECRFPITASLLSNRSLLFMSKKELYIMACDRLNLTIDEINGMEYVINSDASVTTPRGYTFIPTENSIEEFLNEYSE